MAFDQTLLGGDPAPAGSGSGNCQRNLQLVGLPRLMSLSEGRSDIVVALIDGPVAFNHPELAGARLKEIPGSHRDCVLPESQACKHGTLVAGILAARRGSVAPAICPGCTFIVRPIFSEPIGGIGPMPIGTPEELTTALVETVEAGANVINLSAALLQTSLQGERHMEEALDYAARRGVLVVAAAGNQGAIGSSAITRHPWVIPVIGCNRQGNPTLESNLGGSIGRTGLGAPGEGVVSLGTDGNPSLFRGTSAAAPFVTGAIALLWSEFRNTNAGRLKLVLTTADGRKRSTITPPLLNAWAAYQAMSIDAKG